ncbi:hypothetical protein [Nostocoides sp. HKS02]|uniref:hypothetical protein n=1 Tax=Nostocoides sp. HKS02 TaxID=1813880 RepID=UPI0012B47D8D|nr:hypothetical protein [Tetrasphaera sp. HKS02]QGN57112.1 hypothetical protein GKE56_03535 [Tetrasphaera sp. HKS02]
MFDWSFKEAPGLSPEVLGAAALAVTSEDLDAMTVEQAEIMVIATQRAINALAARQARAVDVHAEGPGRRRARRAPGGRCPPGP